SIEGPSLKLPSLPFSSEAEWPLKVSFSGCRNHQHKWKKWVEAMESVHSSVWKRAGIYEAIMGSIYKVFIDKDLILGLVERWSVETNTFVFPWGEATVSLEDMMVLGGFPVLGSSVLSPLHSPELVETEKNLEEVRKELILAKADNHTRWLNCFMYSGSNIEHEAFLSLWLSRFVFPGNEYDKIGSHVFPIAVSLARGMRLALAPVVLASIYRDLGMLKQTMIMVSSNEQCSDGDTFNILEFSLWAPLFLVQVWAWERLVTLQPEQPQNCNMVVSGVRIGRWHNAKQVLINVRNTIDSSGDTFLWRPYTLAGEGWLVPKFYKENEEWIEGKKLEQGMESFIQCLRVCELVGLDCQEPYRPNRVAMQFGYDQDFPKWIPRSPSSPELAWYNYSRPIDSDLRFYCPSRLFEADVTKRYLEWWRKEILFLADPLKGLSRGRRSKRNSKRLSNLYASPVSAPKLRKIKVETDLDGLPTESQQKQVKNYPAVPPGFSPQYRWQNDKNLSIGVSQTMACDIVPPGFLVKHTSEEKVCTPTDHAGDKNEIGNVVLSKGGVENVKKNLSIGVSRTMACDIVTPHSTKKRIAAETVYSSTDYAHGSNESSTVVPPKCVVEYDKENFSVEACRTGTGDIVPPGLTESHYAGQSVHKSTEAHDSNGSSSVVPPNCFCGIRQGEFIYGGFSNSGLRHCASWFSREF
uniref:Aminotransferase-like plant mobile domain-containing protein n=1 Tax=Solanum lycopersicum TaxID=4081 RepID=A0A3Q7HI82_SOLLC